MLTSPSELSHVIKSNDGGPYLVAGADAVSLSYPTHGNDACNAIEGVSFWFRHRNTCITHLVSRRLQDGVFLDVGGGNGSTTKSLAVAGIDCWLIEPNPAGCRNAQDRGIQTIFLASLDALCFPADSVAGVGLFDVIEHIENTSELLSEAYRILVPGGMLAVTVPAIPWLWSTEDEYAGHFRRYTRKALRRDLDSIGFEVELVQYLFGPLVFPLLACRSIPSRLGLRRGGNWGTAAHEHGVDGGWGASIVRRLLHRERKRFKRNRWPLLGTTCIAIARKPDRREDD